MSHLFTDTSHLLINRPVASADKIVLPLRTENKCSCMFCPTQTHMGDILCRVSSLHWAWPYRWMIMWPAGRYTTLLYLQPSAQPEWHSLYIRLVSPHLSALICINHFSCVHLFVQLWTWACLYLSVYIHICILVLGSIPFYFAVVLLDNCCHRRTL